MERKEGMTPSFSFLEERLLIALAPACVQRYLAAHSASPAEIVRWDERAWKDHGLPKRAWAPWQEHLRRTKPRLIVEACERDGIRILFPDAPDWPAQISHLHTQAPSVLFVRGTLSLQPHIAIIGTRRPTPYGERVTDRLIAELQPSGACILSGLALGTDGRAHAQALRQQLPTVAVLGGGIGDADIYPRAHFHLAKEILNQGGALVSERPPNAPVLPGAFPARNRIIAALCRAVVVIEARERSGTLITARIALELGRDVLAVPGSVFSEASIGTHQLLQAGAHLCLHAKDVWKALSIDAPTEMRIHQQHLHLHTEDRALIYILQKDTSGLTLDELGQAANRSTDDLLVQLGLLELQGLVEQTHAGRWRAV